jgi:hypothetical protein
VTWREEDEIYNFLVILSSVSRHPQLLSERYSILEYYGRDFAEAKKKQSATVGYSQTISFPLQPINLPQQKETPNLPFKTFW